MADRPLMEDVVKRAFDANMRYWETVGRATTEYVQAVTKIWADVPITWTPGVSPKRASNGVQATAPALLLEAIAGAQARATIMVSNDLDREAEAQISVSSLRGPDGAFIAMDIRTMPETVKLAAGARVPVTLTADITDAITQGVDYHGEINVPGLSPRGVPLVLRRRA
jgi:hypothetical protein